MALDITALYNVSSGAIKEAAKTAPTARPETYTDKGFDSLLHTAIDNLSTTNNYLSDAENEKIKWALGETENTHDLSIALQKASTALQYTVAIRDKLMEAYRELIQMQI
ncbi:MAG: flagellar hook-basal body complex protein FliE [Lachnospiraceae bacterium]|jgi:flagellar hook-basal body complex protein FliE|nr:flagellar hook-basal body complex protein FliE [Lachnospiraceae bacterium]